MVQLSKTEDRFTHGFVIGLLLDSFIDLCCEKNSIRANASKKWTFAGDIMMHSFLCFDTLVKHQNSLLKWQMNLTFSYKLNIQTPFSSKLTMVSLINALALSHFPGDPLIVKTPNSPSFEERRIFVPDFVSKQSRFLFPLPITRPINSVGTLTSFLYPPVFFSICNNKKTEQTSAQQKMLKRGSVSVTCIYLHKKRVTCHWQQGDLMKEKEFTYTWVR